MKVNTVKCLESNKGKCFQSWDRERILKQDMKNTTLKRLINVIGLKVQQ